MKSPSRCALACALLVSLLFSLTGAAGAAPRPAPALPAPALPARDIVGQGWAEIAAGMRPEAGVVTDCTDYAAPDGLGAALAAGGAVTFACSGTIVVPAPIVIAQNTTLDAGGQDVTLSGNDSVQVFRVNPGIMLTLQHLTVAHGRVTGTPGTNGGDWQNGGPGGDAYGGCVYNDGGVVTANDTTFSACAAVGGTGGAGGLGSDGGTGGRGCGAAVYNNGGRLNLVGSTVTGCTAQGGAGGYGGNGYNGYSYCCDYWWGTCWEWCWSPGVWGGDGGSGGQGCGGAVSGAGSPPIDVEATTFSANAARGGNGGAAGYGDGHVGYGGSGGMGYAGAIDNTGGLLTAVGSSLTGNLAAGGYPGSGSGSTPPGTGRGGGLANAGVILMFTSTFYGNSADGYYSYGGGLYNTGTATLHNTTWSANGGSSYYRYGGAVYNESGSLTLRNNTLEANVAAGYYGGSAGAIYANSGSASLSNTILANNVPQNCQGALTSLRYNLDSGSSCSLAAAGDLSNVNPLLGPLQDNGGGTLTHALLPASPALDAGNPSSPWWPTDPDRCPTADQRQVSRSQHGRCDIGAYEAVWVQLDTPSASVGEGQGSAPLAVTLGGLSPITVTVEFSTTDGTALAGSDYAVTSGTLSIPPGTLGQTLAVPILDDLLDEPDETFTLTVSSPGYAVLDAIDRETVTIVDDDRFDLSASSKAAGAAKVRAGEVLTYSLVLSNSGNLSAGVVLTDPIPAGLAVLTPTLSGGAVYSPTANQVVYSGTLPGFSLHRLSFGVEVGVMVSGTVLANVAYIDDGQGVLTRTAAVTVVNAPPLAGDDVAAVLEDGVVSLDVLANDTDAENGPLFLAALGAPLHGTAAVSGTVLVAYSPAPDWNGQDVFTYTVADEQGARDSALVTVTVVPVNDAPRLAPIGDRAADEGSLLSFTAVATDIESPPGLLSFTLDPGAPWGAAITAGGVFTWTPDESQGPGVYSVTVRVGDDAAPALSDAETLTVTVAEVNRPPVLAAIGQQVVDEETLLSVAAVATDPDVPANALAFSLAGAHPAGSAIDPLTGELTWTPGEDQGPGVYTLTVRVDDDGLPPLAAARVVTISVAEVNRAPDAGGDAYPAVEDTPLVVVAPGVLDNDADGDLPAQPLAAGLLSGPAHGQLELRPDGSFVYTPALNYEGDDGFAYRACDDATPPACDGAAVALAVGAVNDPPLAEAGPDRAADEGEGVAFTGSAVDLDGDGGPLTIAWFFGDGATAVGTLTPTHAYGDDGPYTVTLVVTDSEGGVGSDGLVVTVGNVAPQVEAGPDQAVLDGTAATLSGAFSDPGRLDDYAIVWAFGDGATAGGTLTSTHLYPGPGIYQAMLTVADDDGGQGSDTALVTVTAACDLALDVVASAGEARVGESLVYTLTASNAGPSASAGVTVTDWLPDGATLLSASPGCESAGGPLTCRGGALAVGASVAFSVTVEVAPWASGVLTNTAEVAGPEPDPNPGDNAATAAVQVTRGYAVYLPLVVRGWGE